MAAGDVVPTPRLDDEHDRRALRRAPCQPFAVRRPGRLSSHDTQPLDQLRPLDQPEEGNAAAAEAERGLERNCGQIAARRYPEATVERGPRGLEGERLQAHHLRLAAGQG